MSFNSAMQIANNGLNTHASAIKVINHNVANVSTTGFRASLWAAKDLVSSNSGSAIGATNGQGSTLGRVYQSFDTQGSTSTDGVATHMALQSDGFFVVSGRFNGQTGQYFTRDGTFSEDKSGRLVTQEGLVLQGYPVGVDGITGTKVTDLVVPRATLSAPERTSQAVLKANVDGEMAPEVFDINNRQATSELQTNLDVYDSLGAKHALAIYFTPRGPATPGGAGATVQPISYEYNVIADNADLALPLPAGAPLIATGQVYFDSDGRLTSINNLGDLTANFTVSFKNATANQPISINLGDPLSAAGATTGRLGMTAYGNGSSVRESSANGHPQGTLRDYSVDQSGVITAAFSAGDRRVLGQVATARFACAQELQPVGHNLFADTPRSGSAVISGGTATFEGGALEQSNVDLGQELIHALAAERGYQVNARTIQTVNNMYTDLVNIGR